MPKHTFGTDKLSMGVLYIMIGFSLIIALGFLIAFIWAVKKGQYDDDYSPSVRILFDDQNEKKSTTSKE